MDLSILPIEVIRLIISYSYSFQDKNLLTDIKHFYRAIPLGCGWYAGKNEQALQDAKNRRAVVFDKVSNTESQRPIVVDFESNK